MNGWRDIPTAALLEMWCAERERVRHLPNPTPSDCEDLLGMRMELDRRRDWPKPVADVNFSEVYLTD